jgi:hypothetical protein
VASDQMLRMGPIPIPECWRQVSIRLVTGSLRQLADLHVSDGMNQDVSVLRQELDRALGCLSVRSGVLDLCRLHSNQFHRTLHFAGHPTIIAVVEPMGAPDRRVRNTCLKQTSHLMYFSAGNSEGLMVLPHGFGIGRIEQAVDLPISVME